MHVELFKVDLLLTMNASLLHCLLALHEVVLITVTWLLWVEQVVLRLLSESQLFRHLLLFNGSEFLFRLQNVESVSHEFITEVALE